MKTITALIATLTIAFTGVRAVDLGREQLLSLLPTGFSEVTAPSDDSYAAGSSKPTLVASNDRSHLVMMFYDPAGTSQLPEVSAVVQMLKSQPPSPTQEVVASGIIDSGRGGRPWGMVELRDRKAGRPHMEHTIILLPSDDAGSLRVVLGCPEADADSLVDTANKILTNYEAVRDPK